MKPLPQQAEFDFEHNLPAGMETFTVRFLAAWFGTSDQHWLNLIDSGDLQAVDLARVPSRSMMRVPRAALVAYLNGRKTV
jgi:hypothetical protein